MFTDEMQPDQTGHPRKTATDPGAQETTPGDSVKVKTSLCDATRR